MIKRVSLLLLVGACFMLAGCPADQGTGALAGQARERVVKKMTIKGEITKVKQGYFIRGKVPAEVFTILNADPKILDGFLQEGRIVNIEVRIVSGDNVEIERINGVDYKPAIQ
jgi:hypothetical protein